MQSLLLILPLQSLLGLAYLLQLPSGLLRNPRQILCLPRLQVLVLVALPEIGQWHYSVFAGISLLAQRLSKSLKTLPEILLLPLTDPGLWQSTRLGLLRLKLPILGTQDLPLLGVQCPLIL